MVENGGERRRESRSGCAGVDSDDKGERSGTVVEDISFRAQVLAFLEWLSHPFFDTATEYQHIDAPKAERRAKDGTFAPRERK